MYLFFDTETTGFPSKGLHALEPKQARVCQIALLLIDENQKVMAQYSSLLKPHGWKMTEGAQKVHGFSDEMCRKLGVPSRQAFQMFQMFHNMATHVVAHNLAFDTQMINLEAEAHGEKPFEFKDATCTMLKTKNICKLPGRYNDYKWPKLEESLRIVCNKEIGDDAHDAMVDTKACRDIFFELQRRKQEQAA